jgi:hypothetical protein
MADVLHTWFAQRSAVPGAIRQPQWLGDCERACSSASAEHPVSSPKGAFDPLWSSSRSWPKAIHR